MFPLGDTWTGILKYIYFFFAVGILDGVTANSLMSSRFLYLRNLNDLTGKLFQGYDMTKPEKISLKSFFFFVCLFAGRMDL